MLFQKLRFAGGLYILAVATIFAQTEQTLADTTYEIQLNSHYLFLDISEKRGPQYSDDFANTGFVVSAYRQASRNKSWGAAIEYAIPVNRDAEFGDGDVLGFRPVNFLIQINDTLASEFYLGAAQYNWEKTARGYYFGANIRYRFANTPVSLVADYRFHQDMAYDSPLGDVIIQGSSVGGGIIFHF